MGKVLVYNDNVHPYQEKFKDMDISIAAGGSIEMDYDDAISFKGSFKMPTLDVDGNHTPKGYKMIRIESMGSAEAAPTPKVDENICYACKYKASSKADLAEHAKVSHSDIQIKDEKPEDHDARSKIKPRGVA